MRVALLLTCLWPGLAPLWWRGDRWGVVTAAAFSAWLNLALAARFIWPELLPPLGSSLVWTLLWVFWVGCFCHSVSRLGNLRGKNQDRLADDLFIRAQAEYLKGHWYEAESLLQKLLDRQPGDIEARLTLATLFRHTRRIREAREQLKAIGRLEGAGRWHVELHQELRLLRRLTEDAELTEPTEDRKHPAAQAA